MKFIPYGNVTNNYYILACSRKEINSCCKTGISVVDLILYAIIMQLNLMFNVPMYIIVICLLSH